MRRVPDVPKWGASRQTEAGVSTITPKGGTWRMGHTISLAVEELRLETPRNAWESKNWEQLRRSKVESWGADARSEEAVTEDVLVAKRVSFITECTPPVWDWSPPTPLLCDWTGLWAWNSRVSEWAFTSHVVSVPVVEAIPCASSVWSIWRTVSFFRWTELEPWTEEKSCTMAAVLMDWLGDSEFSIEEEVCSPPPPPPLTGKLDNPLRRIRKRKHLKGLVPDYWRSCRIQKRHSLRLCTDLYPPTYNCLG